MAVVAVVVVGVGAYGYYDANIRPQHETALAIGERKFDMAYMERRLRYTINTASPGDAILYNEWVALQTVINDLIDEEIGHVGAPSLGLSVSDEEIDAEIRQALRIPEGDREAFAEAYRREVRESGLRPGEYREVIAASILNEKLRQYFRIQVPAIADQARLRVIRVETEEEAQNVLERLRAGEDFALLAAELSLDIVTKDKGGEMDWVARGGVPPEVEEAVFALEVNQLTEPVLVDESYNVYQVLEKAAEKEVTPEQRTQIEQQLYSNWRSQIGQGVQAATYMTSEQIDKLVQIAREEGAGVSSE